MARSATLDATGSSELEVWITLARRCCFIFIAHTLIDRLGSFAHPANRIKIVRATLPRQLTFA